MAKIIYLDSEECWAKVFGEIRGLYESAYEMKRQGRLHESRRCEGRAKSLEQKYRAIHVFHDVERSENERIPQKREIQNVKGFKPYLIHSSQ
jgi:hypothetical protein